MGRATSKANEAKSKMKQPSDMPHRDSNTGGSDLWSNKLPLDHGGALIYIYICVCVCVCVLLSTSSSNYKIVSDSVRKRL